MKETISSSLPDTLFPYLDDPKTLCVFPSETVRRSWLQKYTLDSQRGVILIRKVLSWDRFIHLFHDPGERAEAGIALRYLFAYSFLEEKGGELRYLRQDSYPEMQKQYIHTIVTLIDRLPMLAFLARKENHAYSQIPEAYRRDMNLLRASYERFLTDHTLFDPHFSTPVFPHDALCAYERFVIIAPELCSGFFEYEQMLKEVPGVFLVHAREPRGGTLTRYENERQELIAVFTRIRSLLDEGTHPHEIALSVGDLSRMMPFIERMSWSYDIPLRMHSGRYLSDYPAGAFFLLMEEVSSEDFSFESVKRFLLDARIPWKKKDLHRQLIARAISEDIRQIVPTRENDQWKTLRSSYLNELFSLIRTCTHTHEPRTIISVVQQLTDHFLANDWGYIPSQEVQSPASQSLSAAVQVLVDLEKGLSALSDPAELPLFSLFTTLLKKQTFYPAGSEAGIAVFDYPAGVISYPSYHFFIGFTSQSVDTSGQKIPLLSTFSSPDVQSEASFNSAFLSGSSCTFSYANAGYGDTVSLPPSRFLSQAFEIREGENIPSLETLEELRWRGRGDDTKARRGQAKGFYSACAAVFQGKSIDIPRGDVYPVWDELADDKGFLHLSSTTLDMADGCPAKFFAQKVLGLHKGIWDVQSLDHRAIGDLQHEILARFYETIEERGELSAAQKRELLTQIINTEAKKKPKRRSATPLYVTRFIRSAYLENLLSIIEKEDALFSLTRSLGLETTVERPLTSVPVVLEGRIDRIFSYEREERVCVGILDYKKSSPPRPRQYKNPVYPLSSYQLPFYAILLEGSQVTGSTQIDSGNYYSIQQEAFTQIWSESEHLDAIKRVCIEAMEKLFERLQKGHLEAHVSKENCRHCDYRQICRRRYVLP